MTSSPGNKEWSALPPTLTEAGCHCGQFAGVVMKSKTCSMGWRIWMLLQMRVIRSLSSSEYVRRARLFLHLFVELDVSHGAQSSHDRPLSSEQALPPRTPGSLPRALR